MTKISWCDETINPIVGCSKISDGCQNCYAEKMALRLAAMGLSQYERVVHQGGALLRGWNGTTDFVESELCKPHKWKKPRSIFIGSMGDVFHNTANIRWILDVLDMVYGCPQHTFIMLTKRPENMKLVIDACVEGNGILPNLVLGVSVENQETADQRIPVLLQIPAARRFISLEPMLGPVDLTQFITNSAPKALNMLSRFYGPNGFDPTGTQIEVSRIVPAIIKLSGVILGGESGLNARPMHPDWVCSVRDQCKAAGVPFMFKQWGEWLTNPHEHGYSNLGTLVLSGKKSHKWPGEPFIDPAGLHYSGIANMVGSKLAGRLLDGRTHTDLPWTLRK